jgi:hypothetical protein
MIRRDAALAQSPIHPALTAAGIYALLMGLTKDDGVVHVPRVLAHRMITPQNDGDALAARAAAVAHVVSRQGASTRIGPHGTVAVDWPCPKRGLWFRSSSRPAIRFGFCANA